MACLLERRAGALPRRLRAADTRLRTVLVESGRVSACTLKTRNKARDVNNYGLTPVNADVGGGVVGVAASAFLRQPVRFIITRTLPVGYSNTNICECSMCLHLADDNDAGTDVVNLSENMFPSISQGMGSTSGEKFAAGEGADDVAVV